MSQGLSRALVDLAGTAWLIAALMALSIATQAADAETCPSESYGATNSSYDPTSGHCFYGYANSSVIWSVAEDSCNAIGGYLAVIDSAAENTIARAALPALHQSPWIGFSDLAAEAGSNPFAFVNVLGGPLTFNGFAPGEPSSSGDEDCVHFLTEGLSDLWNDLPCHFVEPFICEVEGPPGPPPTPTSSPTVIIEATLTPTPNCSSELAQCTADLVTLQTALADQTADADQDGRRDLDDTCPGTVTSVAVDQTGCSVDQFCSAFDVTVAGGKRTCRKADWRNDEPTMRARDRDCGVVGAACVPAP